MTLFKPLNAKTKNALIETVDVTLPVAVLPDVSGWCWWVLVELCGTIVCSSISMFWG